MKRACLAAGALALVLGAALCSPSHAASARRIVSLAPSLTEIVYAIGCAPALVADTSYDDYPAAARGLPHVADLITVDLERLAVLRPTEVIALHDQERQGEPVSDRLGIPVTYLPNRDLNDLFADISGVGTACGRESAAAALSAHLRTQIAVLTAQAARRHARPRVLFLLDLPGFTVGRHSFLDDLIRRAGGVNVAGGIGQPYPNVSAEWLLTVQPDVILVSRATPFDAAIRAREPWRSLRAVQRAMVFQPPSDDIVQRNGPRIVLGLRWLIQAIAASR